MWFLVTKRHILRIELKRAILIYSIMRLSPFSSKHVDVHTHVTKMPPLYIEGKRSRQTIVLMVAAYRDPFCGNMLFELFSKAEFPDRDSAAIIQHMDSGDVDCIQDDCDRCKEQDGMPCCVGQVKDDIVPLNQTIEAMAARYRQSLLIEEFCLQTDSHSAFELHWVAISLEDWLLIVNEMAVVTTYSYGLNDRNIESDPPVRCSTKFSDLKEI
jgi:hypothetical protein